MAAVKYALVVLTLAAVLASSYAASDSDCPCCKTVRLSGTSQFIYGVNEFYVVPGDTGTRPGSASSFSGAFVIGGVNSGRYSGIITRTGNTTLFQTASVTIDNGPFAAGSISFSGAIIIGPTTTVYAVNGGTGRLVGASGTATETSLGNMSYRVDFDIRVDGVKDGLRCN